MCVRGLQCTFQNAMANLKNLVSHALFSLHFSIGNFCARFCLFMDVDSVNGQAGLCARVCCRVQPKQRSAIALLLLVAGRPTPFIVYWTVQCIVLLSIIYLNGKTLNFNLIFLIFIWTSAGSWTHPIYGLIELMIFSIACDATFWFLR